MWTHPTSGCNVRTSLFSCVSRYLFSWSRFTFGSCFFVGQKIQQSARCWVQVPVFTGIPYVKTGWKNAIDYRFGPERGFMSEKSLPSILCKGRKGLQSGDSAKKSLQTMLLVGKVPLQEGEKKVQSAMFFTIFCRWGGWKGGTKICGRCGLRSWLVRVLSQAQFNLNFSEWVEGFAEGILDTVGKARECNV